MARKLRELINSPPPNHISRATPEVLRVPLKKRGRPTVSRGERCRSALSFSLFKVEEKTSWAKLEETYHGNPTALNNAQGEPDGADLHRTFLRYGSGRQTPCAEPDGRLEWAKKRSAAFTAMYDSVLFDFLDLQEDDEGARVQFACWLWRTTMHNRAELRDVEFLHTPPQVAFRCQMKALLQAPRHYGKRSQVPARLPKHLALLNGRRFDASVIENFSVTQKSAPSWVIAPPYQDAQQLQHLRCLEHPDALCIMLFGVMYPGTQPGVRELAIAGCEAWLTRWLARYPGLGKGLQVFFNVLGSQVNELKPFLALHCERTLAKQR